MGRTNLLLFLVALCGCGTAAHSGAGPAPETVRLQLEAQERAWADALVRRDSAALERLLAPEYVLIVSAAPERPVSRSTWLAQALGPYVIRSFRFERPYVRAQGNVVVVSGHATQEASVNGADRSGTFFLTDVWTWREGRWQVLTRYSSHPEGSSASSRAVTGS